MRLRGVAGTMAGLALLAVNVLPQASTTAKKTTAEALKEKLDKGERVLVIDVRSDEEVKTGSIPGAIHVPMEQLEARMKDIPKDIELVFT
jgi:rhodanese-related sulfurtransferase